jgi:LmbE family N-acetylglucosaminyl deacetylase
VETKRLREQEAREAARILGVRHLEFWRAPDGAVRATDGLVRRLQAELRAFSPDNIYVTHERETHPDHRGAARLVRKSVSALNGQRPVVFMFELWTPIQRLDKIVDISSHLENKLRAVRAYRSQCAVVGFVEAVRGLNRYRGEMHSWPGGDYAEAFTRMRL